ncbi:MAG: hypothetical protein RLZZ225_840 [Pseudomonadota bacterium]|jgi:hypothetical protein
MIGLANKNFFAKPKSRQEIAQRKRVNYLYKLDCNSGLGIVNPLLVELEKISSAEFNRLLSFILKKCINVNRDFSDAVKFLSIWLKNSPATLLARLKRGELKTFFYQTEYYHDGDQWYFPQLLQNFAVYVRKNKTAENILHHLFENFDFASITNDFIRAVIGYDRLERCVREIPPLFKRPLLVEVLRIIQEHDNQGIYIDIGHASYAYLKKQLAIQQNPVATTATNTRLIAQGIFQPYAFEPPYYNSRTYNRFFLNGHY